MRPGCHPGRTHDLLSRAELDDSSPRLLAVDCLHPLCRGELAQETGDCGPQYGLLPPALLLAGMGGSGTRGSAAEAPLAAGLAAGLWAGAVAGAVGMLGVVEAGGTVRLSLIPGFLGASEVLGTSLSLGISFAGTAGGAGGRMGAPSVAHGLATGPHSQDGLQAWCDLSLSNRLGRGAAAQELQLGAGAQELQAGAAVQPHDGLGANFALSLSRQLAFGQPQEGAGAGAQGLQA